MNIASGWLTQASTEPVTPKISTVLPVSRPAVSQHLKVLRQVGLVVPERQGYWKPYSLDEEALENCRAILNQLCNCGGHRPGECRRHELGELNLAELKAYEKKIQRELKKIQRAISRMGQDER